MQATDVKSYLFPATTRGGLHLIITPPLLAQHIYRVFTQDRRGQFHRRTLNGVEEVLKKRCVYVVVIHVPKQRIDCQKRLAMTAARLIARAL